jgi:hypothetical protein
MKSSQQFWQVPRAAGGFAFFVLVVIDRGMTINGTSRVIGGAPAASMVFGFVIALQRR